MCGSMKQGESREIPHPNRLGADGGDWAAQAVAAPLTSSGQEGSA